jgi:hypothetical protein
MYDKYEEMINSYPILYMKKLASVRDKFSYCGFSCPDGWYEPINRLSCKLETLNETYKKYGVYIQASQAKEKLGTLRFYYNVVMAPRQPYRFICNIIDYIIGLLSKVNYKYIYKNFTRIPTKHKLLFKIKSCLDKIYTYFYYTNRTDKQQNILQFLDNEASKLILEAEEDCYNLCQDCGNQIGTEFSPRCKTGGWITYICKSCYDKKQIEP